MEVKPYSIRTTVISPGAVATELPDSVTEADVSEGIQKFYGAFAIPANSFARAVAFAMRLRTGIQAGACGASWCPDCRSGGKA